jgi:hypothetical protein
MIYYFHTLELLLTLILKSTQSWIHNFSPSTYSNSLTFILIHPHFIQPLTFILAPTAKITNPITIECLNLETIR